ncbi:alpha/beta hydrolase [uncultured Sphingomonas sp.]|uniref:alpha/beta fold hydrolase n=1 Tax=uncultured Sphingomonas sp. TaxID=158754 RepID=UPI0025FC5085|nr:alpha/beta hydrolase [uncultured Sphingomonas sp.]
MAHTAYRDGWCYSADDLRLHFRDYAGDPGRKPVLCIPGLTRNARDFEGVAARLAGTRRVVAVDLRGRGGSDFAADPLSYVPAVYLQDLMVLIAAERLGPVVVIGTSLGGLLAMLMAATTPALLRGVLLNDVGPVLNPEGMARIRAYVGRDVRFASWEDAAEAIAANHAGGFPDYTAADWSVLARRLCREGQDGRILFDYDPAIAEPFTLPQPAIDLWPAFDGLAGLPATLVRGRLSDVLSAETAAAMAARMPAIERVTLPRIGYAPTLEEPESVAAIDRLLATVDHE